MTPVPPGGDSGDIQSQQRMDAEVRQAVRYERGLAVKLFIALGVVALIVLIRLLVV
jgi:hypothetical protein